MIANRTKQNQRPFFTYLRLGYFSGMDVDTSSKRHTVRRPSKQRAQKKSAAQWEIIKELQKKCKTGAECLAFLAAAGDLEPSSHEWIRSILRGTGRILKGVP